MIYFVTVHFESDSWIDIQLRQIARHTPEDYQVWACLNDIDPRHASKFAAVYDLEGEHGAKLNVLARRVSEVALPDDILVFIDGDAFPIDDWVDQMKSLLLRYPLVAVRRDENLGDPQPHPCFTVTTPRFWNEIGGDWSRGGQAWINTAGRQRADAGSRVLSRLQELDVPWHPLLRSNKRELHAVLFGVYEDIVYHHGAGFRPGRTSYDTWQARQTPWLKSRLLVRLLARTRLQDRLVSFRLRRIMGRNLELSERIYEEIRREPGFVNRFFLSAENDTDAAADIVA